MAGLQTMALVSMGSALYVILGAYGFDRDVDPTRVVAQIVTGVGFLGAGVIMKQGSSVVGLNTAATLWATAAVGALAGAWAWREAVAGAVIIIDALSGPGMRLKSLGWRNAETPQHVVLSADVSAVQRDDTRLENAVRTLSAEPTVRLVEWSTKNEAAADLARRESG